MTGRSKTMMTTYQAAVWRGLPPEVFYRRLF